MVVKEKVLVYLVWRSQLLTFIQPASPDAGRQVVAGSIEAGEDILTAAVRELKEESGIDSIQNVESLGTFRYSMRKFGRSEIHERHVVLALAPESAVFARHWMHREEHSATIKEPVEFEFTWIPLRELTADSLIGGHGYFLPILSHRLREW
jgi:8-oxo-dGTP pyrophosphatase MutT (NUDIX family)